MKTVRQFSAALLFVIAFTAIIMGIVLLNDVSGKTLQLSVDDLKGTGFVDYSTPAWLLIVTIGILGLIASIFTIVQAKKYFMLILIEGMIVLIWIILLIITQEFRFVYLVFGLFALALLLLGNLLAKNQNAILHNHSHQAEHQSQNNGTHKKSHYHKHRKRGH